MQEDVKLESAHFNDQDPEFESCVLQSIPTKDSLLVTMDSACGTPLLQAVMAGRPIIDLLSVKPNPVRGDASAIHLELRARNACDVAVRVLDLSGKLCLEVMPHLLTGDQSLALPMLRLGAGEYTIELTDGSGRSTRRFVVLH